MGDIIEFPLKASLSHLPLQPSAVPVDFTTPSQPGPGIIALISYIILGCIGAGFGAATVVICLFVSALFSFFTGIQRFFCFSRDL